MSIRVVKLIFQIYLPFQGRFPRVSGQAKMLRDAGHEVTILACDRTGTHPVHEVIDGIDVERIRVPAGEMRGPLRQLVPILVFYVRAFRWLWRRPLDMLHCHNLDVLPLGYLVRLTKGVRLLFDAHEPNYYALWPKRLQFMVQLLERLDVFFAKRCDGVSVTNGYQVQKYRQAGVRRVELIGNYPQPELRALAEADPGPRPYMFGRLGTFYPEVGLEETMAAFRELTRKHPQLKLLLAGRVVDNYQAQFQKAIGPLGERVSWTGPFPASRMPGALPADPRVLPRLPEDRLVSEHHPAEVLRLDGQRRPGADHGHRWPRGRGPRESLRAGGGREGRPWDRRGNGAAGPGRAARGRDAGERAGSRAPRV